MDEAQCASAGGDRQAKHGLCWPTCLLIVGWPACCQQRMCCWWLLQAVESCLMANLAEHLNAELVLGTIQDVAGAIQWFKSSFLYRRVRSNPQHYG